MKALYFPYTYVSEETAAALGRWFPAVVGYQPGGDGPPAEMRDLAAGGRWEFVVPGPEDGDDPAQAVKELRRWGEMHRDGTGALSAFFQQTPGAGGRDEAESETRIAAEIRRRLSPGRGPDPGAELFAARLFLHLAQEFDRHNRGLQGDLERHNALAEELHRAVSGKRRSGKDPGSGLRQVIGPGAFDTRALAARRLRAWSRLYLRRPFAGPLLVTPGPEVPDALREALPEVSFLSAGLDRLFGQACSGKERAALLEQLARAPAGALSDGFGFRPAPEGDRPRPAAELIVLVGVPVVELAARLSGPGGRSDPAAAADGVPENTLLALVVPEGL
jgi:hypothetical protein